MANQDRKRKDETSEDRNTQDKAEQDDKLQIKISTSGQGKKPKQTKDNEKTRNKRNIKTLKKRDKL